MARRSFTTALRSLRTGGGEISIYLHSPVVRPVIGTGHIEYLPYFDPAEKRLRSQAEDVQLRGCVLIVDDHAIIRTRLRSLFEAQNLQVCEAADGVEGVEKAQQVNPNLIILDLAMPVMNGLEAARALRLIMPHIPLMMFTNNAGAIMEQEALAAGVSALVCKTDADCSDQLLAHAKVLLAQ